LPSLWLLLSILADFGFIQFFKLGQRRGCHGPILVCTNYVVVAASLAVYLAVTGGLTLSGAAVRTGIVTGILFVSSLSLMTRVLDLAPVGTVLTAFRMSISVPVALGVWLWGEPVAPAQLGGVLLALAALVMMTSGSGGSSARLSGAATLALLLAVCLVQGLGHTSMRSVHYAGLDSEFVQVLMVTGATGGVLGWSAQILRRRRPLRSELLMGAGIGLYNALALCIVMTGLSLLPGTIFYPVVGCSVVLLDNLSAHFVWKERLTRRAGAGVALAVVAIVLVI
jgi:hypothetical protein